MGNLRKIFFILTLLFLSFSFKANSEVVNKVDIIGNERISLETIVVFGDITIGKNYESSDINLLIKKLYETTFFSDISVELKIGVLSIAFKENPTINSIVLRGEKAEKYKTAINNLFNLKEKISFINNYVKSYINVMKEFYRSLGYYFVKIDSKLE